MWASPEARKRQGWILSCGFQREPILPLLNSDMEQSGDPVPGTNRSIWLSDLVLDRSESGCSTAWWDDIRKVN
jgi:hypothetical protein